MNEKILAIWLSEALGPGSVYGKRLLEQYGSFEAVYRLSFAEYERAGIKSDSVVMSRLLSKDTDYASKCAAFCDQNYFSIIEYTSNMYPQRLRIIKDAPPVLYVRGRLIDFDDNVCIAVVGTRSYSDAGWNSTYKITSGLASGGAVIVTGLASGIDTAATRAALDSSGFAVGVLGSGLEKIFPSENRELFEEMYRKGLVITERAPFSEITGSYFPTRNRIISGLSNAVLIGEGSTRSGAMITAAHASEQGRRIYAIPADISNPESTGVNKLVRDGAVPVFDAWDILEGYVYRYPHRISANGFTHPIDVPEKRSTKRVRVLKGKTGISGNEKNTRISSDDNITGNTVTVTVQNKKSAEITKTSKEKEYDIKPQVSNEQPIYDNRREVFDMSILDSTEKKVYECISAKGAVIADCIGEEIGEDNIDVNIALTVLEMYELIETEGAIVRIKSK